jgi:tetratricopeptide (TPR) repeat protein
MRLSPRRTKNASSRFDRQPETKPLFAARRRWLFRLILLLFPFLLFGLLEISLRLDGYGYRPQLFKRLTIGGAEYYVQNEDFSRRFFPKELTRHPGPIRFPVHKAPGTFRIFVFGESAAMGDPVESFAPDRYLGVLLRERYSDIKFEIINVAFTAINSHVILPMARECATHEGDLWIIYMGNNEMVGPYGAATVFGWQTPRLSFVRLALAFQRLRTGQWLMELGRRITSRGTRAAWGGMGMFLNNPVSPDNPRKEIVYRNFQKNLDDIVRAGLNSGAKILLNTVAVNLKDCPPFASMLDSRLKPSVRAQFDRAYTNGLQAVAAKECLKATDRFEQAGRIDAKSAELQFHWGEALLLQTNFSAARERFQLACDDDALPFRADSRINAEIRAEQQRIANENLILFDAAAALAAQNETGICGQETFFEHVHFDLDGRYRLARAWAEQIERFLPRSTNAWVSQQVCEQRLGLSPWNRAQALHFMDERMQTPPLSGQANNVQRRQELQARINELGRQMNAANAARTRQDFLRLLGQLPEDFFLCQEFAVFLELTGDVAGSAKEWRRYCGLVPQDSLGYSGAGRMLNALGRYAEAETSLRTATAIRPGQTDAWVEFGSALAGQKQYYEALACFSTALKQDPKNPQILIRQGKVLAALGRRVEAMASYRAAIELNPKDGLPHHELGVELVLAGQPGPAGNEFREAAQLSPDTVPARFDYGAWLMSQGRMDEAQQEFEAVLRLEPGNLAAQQRIVSLQAGDKHAGKAGYR